MRVAHVLIVATLLVGASGCGQQGPLVLPQQARPIERIDSPPGEEQQQTDDEQQDER